MEKEIEKRFYGLDDIRFGLFHNLELMKYISFNLHNEPFSLLNNIGLQYIWGGLMANQIIDFYKLIGKNEKFSFIKILNIAKNLKVNVDYETLGKKITELINEYEKTEFETVRSKYIAHQDLDTPEIETDLISINSFSEKIFELFELFSTQFNREIKPLTKVVTNSFSEIFNEIDKFEKIKAFLFVSKLKGNKSVNITDFENILENNNS